MNIIAQNDKFILRTWTIDDSDIVYRLNNDVYVLKHTADKPFDSTKQAHKFVTEYNDFEKYGCGRWMVCTMKGVAIGWCGLEYDPLRDYHVLNYRFFREYLDSKYAMAASKLVIEYAKSTMKLDKILAFVNPVNKQGVRILEKLDFIVFDTKLDALGFWLCFELDLKR